MSPCHPFRPVPGQCGPNRRGPLPAPPFDPRDYWATRKCVSRLYASLETKLDKADVVDPGAATEAGKAADAKSTYEELSRILAKLAKKADKATTLAGYGITDAATKTEIAAKADLVGGKVPAAQLPSFVDGVLEYDTVSAFPATGESGKIYVAKDTNLVYRWSGTQYVEISTSPVLDDTVTETSSNGVKSSGVWSWVKSLLPQWLTSDYAEPATAASVEVKADKATTLAGYGITDAVPLVEDLEGLKTAVTIGGRRIGEPVGPYSLANGDDVIASGVSSHAEGDATTASGNHSHAEGSYTNASGNYSHAEGTVAIADGQGSHAEGENTIAFGIGSHTDGINSQTRSGDQFAFAWNGDDERTNPYLSHGPGTFNINPVGGTDGFYIGEQTLAAILTNKADKVAPSAAGNLAALTADGDIEDSGKKPGDFRETTDNTCHKTTSAAGEWSTVTKDGDVWSVYCQDAAGLSVWVLRCNGTYYPNASTKDVGDDTATSLTWARGVDWDKDFDITFTRTFTTLASKGHTFVTEDNAARSLECGEGDAKQTVAVENGVAKLDDFFTNSNGLLNGRLAYSRNETGLKDRAFNALTFDGTEYNLSTALAAVTPTASGQPRDLLIVATATAATTISFTAGTIKGDKPTIDGAGTWLITLTEYAANTWYCRQIKMEDAA